MMRFITLIFALLLLAGCFDEKFSGTYYYQALHSHYFKFGKDGKFVKSVGLKPDMVPSAEKLDFSRRGNTITVKNYNGSVRRTFTIENDGTLTFYLNSVNPRVVLYKISDD